MAQHDYVIANQSGSSFRSDLNNALSAIVSQNSGASEPSTTYAYQLWADTTAGVLKMRNGANSAWITLRELDGTMAIEAGTAAAPGLYFVGDPNTGLYSPGADQVAASTGGTERLRIDSSGNVGIGAASPTQRLQVTDGTLSNFYVAPGYNSGSGTLLAVGGGEYLAFATNGLTNERLRIDSQGGSAFKTEVGTTAPVASSNTNASFSNSTYYAEATRAANSAYQFFYAGSGAGADTEYNLRGDGNAFADGTWSGGGADYAEYFEWSDGNPDAEDRRGIAVVLDGDKIRPAAAGEDPIGVISGNPSVVGDAAWNKWSGKYLRDDYGTYIQEDYEVEDEDGNTVIQQRRKLNPDYDPEQEYINRENRPEWDCVGLMGKLRIRTGQPTGSRWIKMRDISPTIEEWLVR